MTLNEIPDMSVTSVSTWISFVILNALQCWINACFMVNNISVMSVS